jgi:hypothetical protein
MRCVDRLLAVPKRHGADAPKPALASASTVKHALGALTSLVKVRSTAPPFVFLASASALRGAAKRLWPHGCSLVALCLQRFPTQVEDSVDLLDVMKALCAKHFTSPTLALPAANLLRAFAARRCAQGAAASVAPFEASVCGAIDAAQARTPTAHHLIQQLTSILAMLFESAVSRCDLLGLLPSRCAQRCRHGAGMGASAGAPACWPTRCCCCCVILPGRSLLRAAAKHSSATSIGFRRTCCVQSQAGRCKLASPASAHVAHCMTHITPDCITID